jgi:elongation factor G
MIEAAAETTEKADEQVPRGATCPRPRSSRGLRARTLATRSFRCSAAPRSRTRACRRCSTRSSRSCRAVRSSAGQGHRRERAEEASRKPATTEPFSALAFKILQPIRTSATLTFFRVYSGTLNSGDTVYNPVKGRKERIGRMLQMHANQRDEIKEVRAGDIAAAVGLKDVTTGDTLCALDHVITLRTHGVPGARDLDGVEPKTKARPGEDGHRAVSVWRRKIQSFRVRTDEESGQTIISGMGELHLEIIVDRMKREFKRRGQCRQAAGGLSRDDPRAVKQEGKFVRQSGGRGQYGHVVLEDRAARAR